MGAGRRFLLSSHTHTFTHARSHTLHSTVRLGPDIISAFSRLFSGRLARHGQSHLTFLHQTFGALFELIIGERGAGEISALMALGGKLGRLFLR